MRKFLSCLAVMTSCAFSAQNFCMTTEMQNAWFAEHPELKAAFDKLQMEAAELDREQFSNGYGKALHKSAASAANYTIPVVFHILHTGGPENISDAQVKDAVRILNEDFNKLNADTVNVVTQFKNNIGNAGIEFMLATRDPQGNCTNGIIKHWDTNTNWGGNGYLYTWPRNMYLNIYVVKSMGGGAAGYTYLPGSVGPTMDAIVILSTYVGSIGSSNAYVSRALTHEVGHWLNLPHVWGGTNQPGVACGDDGVSDTPLTKGFSSCNLGNAVICTAGIVENVQNYMEYAYCPRMYTTGQALRMQNAINSPVSARNNLSTPANLALTGITNPGINCLTQLDIISSAYTVCVGQSTIVKSFTFNAAPSAYLWSTDNGATVQNPTGTLTPITFNNPGLTIVSCQVSNNAGVSTKTMAVTVLGGASAIGSTYSQSFETPSLPANWTVINEAPASISWNRYPNAAATGKISMYLATEELPANSVEILESAPYDFKNNPGATFTFKYAYAKQSATQKDIFIVQASSDCGGNWTNIYTPGATQMSQGSGGVTSDLFVPFPSQWKLYKLSDHPNFSPFLDESYVKIRFYFKEDEDGIGFGNRFYLDDVNFSAPVGINDLSRSLGLYVYPNPSSSDFTLRFTLSENADIQYKINAVSGAEVLSGTFQNCKAGTQALRINEDDKLGAGIYILNFQINGVTVSKKLVVN